MIKIFSQSNIGGYLGLYLGVSLLQVLPILNLILISSEGALYVILPYDYQAAARPLFEHTPVLNNNLSINAMMTLVTMISMMTKITKMTISDDNF